MVKPDFRPSTPADGPGITEVLRAAGLSSQLRGAEMHWKYWAPRDDWTGPRSFVIAKGPEIIAHTAIIPGRFLWNGRLVRALHAVDWAARPGVAGAGIAVMKQVIGLADALLSVGGSEQTLRILPHIGFVRIGTAIGYVRPVRPLRLPRAAAGPLWRLPGRLSRRVLWKWSAPRTVPCGWTARVIGCDEMHLLASLLPDPAREGTSTARALGGMTFLARSEFQLRYALKCPIAPQRLFAIEKDGVARGYVLVAMPPGQARIADCWVDSSDPRDWRDSIQCALMQIVRQREVVEIVAWASDPVLQAALTGCGFHARTSEPVQIRMRGTSVPPSLRVQMIDSDAAYQHSGRPRLWT
jgi:hypothetical protein